VPKSCHPWLSSLVRSFDAARVCITVCQITDSIKSQRWREGKQSG
jgi:hypothetical protein